MVYELSITFHIAILILGSLYYLDSDYEHEYIIIFGILFR